MKNIFGIFRADFRRISNSVVASVVIIGLCLVPCLYAWFNILSNWDPYGEASTSNIKVAVANEDRGAKLMGMEDASKPEDFITGREPPARLGVRRRQAAGARGRILR